MLDNRSQRIVRSSRLLSFIVSMLLVSASFAQQAPAPSPAAPVLRVTTHLVLVDVVVYDKQGSHVTNLNSADFTLLDRGKPQKISIFSNERAGDSLAEITPPPPLPPAYSPIARNFAAQKGRPQFCSSMV
jgi:hypothetical protein